MIYIFDVDGTLTPSREKIDPDFKKFFNEFKSKHRTWLVTGSDKEKTQEQIGLDLWGSVERVYQNSGNQMWELGRLKHNKDFVIHKYLLELLNFYLKRSPYPFRYGNHIEQRVGCINFSICGRSCTKIQRRDYREWDEKHQERQYIVREIHKRYPWLEASVGGEISIDIYEKGNNKGQILRHILEGDTFHFFGDRIYPSGNDYPIKTEAEKLNIPNYKLTQVNNWNETWNHLTNIY